MHFGFIPVKVFSHLLKKWAIIWLGKIFVLVRSVLELAAEFEGGERDATHFIVKRPLLKWEGNATKWSRDVFTIKPSGCCRKPMSTTCSLGGWQRGEPFVHLTILDNFIKNRELWKHLVYLIWICNFENC